MTPIDPNKARECYEFVCLDRANKAWDQVNECRKPVLQQVDPHLHRFNLVDVV